MINFKKISAIVSSGLMVGMTMGVAAAANYPAPFVSGGAANVAIVYGTGSGVSILDAVEAGSIQTNLQSFMGSTSGTTSGSVTGEAVALFTGGTKLYINDSLNTIRSTVGEEQMPIALIDGTFSGNVDATITQSVEIGPNPKVTFNNQPKSSDDPVIALTTSTTDANPMFNLTATFNKAINVSHADSQGESFKLFGMDITVGADSDSDSIVLLKSAEKVDLSSDAPTTDVTVAGATYTIELVSASDSAATVKVTNSAGTSESKEIDEAKSKKINGITIAVITADETNLKLSASIIAGADKITLEDGQPVLLGENTEVVDGTLVDFAGANGLDTATSLTKLVISFDAPTSDEDAILPGSSYTDPVFGTIKLDFPGLNIAEDSTARELIEIANSGDDEMSVKFTDYRGEVINTVWAVNSTQSRTPELSYDGDNIFNISVLEAEILHKDDYFIVGNEENARLLKVVSTSNSSSDVKITVQDVATGESTDHSLGADGVGTMSVGGFDYTVTIPNRPSGATAEFVNITVNGPDSASGGRVLYPGIETSKGANVAFYEPLTINLNSTAPSGNGNFSNENITTLHFPDGDGYETVTISSGAAVATSGEFNVTDGTSTTIKTNQTAAQDYTALVTMGNLVYSIRNTSTQGEIKVSLRVPGGANNATSDITSPALIVWEEEDDNNVYNALVVELELGGSSDDGMGVSDITDTWQNDSATWTHTLKSDNDVTKQVDLWGTISSTDSSESDQTTAIISYPDEQVYAELYIAASDASITAGTVSGGGATQLGDVLVKDSEVTSVSTKNLVVVGGSCINSVAAKLVGGAYCGSMWTEKTGAGSGQFLIQSFGDAYTAGKVALLVAGYDVADTANAGKYLRTQTVKTDSSTKYLGTSATSATLQTTESSTTNSSA
ncbi:hypothetical protein HY449_02700 [Candidatus Pacearchaeota archaeon]|nr:hypothetical protein [Candidatus Pacearchaeota archaeon]